jgi:hypothetical protein
MRRLAIQSSNFESTSLIKSPGPGDFPSPGQRRHLYLEVASFASAVRYLLRLYSEDRLRPTATDCNRKKSTLLVTLRLALKGRDVYGWFERKLEELERKFWKTRFITSVRNVEMYSSVRSPGFYGR